jgi:hypothetical protein
MPRGRPQRLVLALHSVQTRKILCGAVGKHAEGDDGNIAKLHAKHSMKQERYQAAAGRGSVQKILFCSTNRQARGKGL